MSAFVWPGRSKLLLPSSPKMAQGSGREWIGVDFASRRSPTGSRALIPLLIVAIVAALGVAALRIDLIRIRYAMAATMAEESALLEEQRALIVRKRERLDPVELAIQARARGFGPPAHVFTLPDPVVGSERNEAPRRSGAPEPVLAAAASELP
jgi:hypothetical protein